MYQKPQLERFGTFRDVTQAGCVSASDNITVNGGGATSVGSKPLPGNSDLSGLLCLAPDTGGSR